MGLLTDLDCRRAKPGDELHDGNRLVLRVGARAMQFCHCGLSLPTRV
jgi:hypothetical protein